MRSGELIDTFIAHFAELYGHTGLRLEAYVRPAPETGADVDLAVNVDGNRLRLLVAAEPTIRSSTVAAALERLGSLRDGNPRTLPVLLGSFISRRYRCLCQEKGIGYADLEGNIFLRSPGIYIEIEREPRGTAQYRQGMEDRGSVFADKASLVLRYLMLAPDHPRGVREIASTCKVNPGWVSIVVRRLEKLNYAARTESGKVKLANIEDMIEAWTRVYAWRLNDHITYYLHEQDQGRILEHLRQIVQLTTFPGQLRYALTLHAGAALIAPFAIAPEVHMYTCGDTFQQACRYWEAGLDLRQVERGGNLILLNPYYRNSVFFEAQERLGLQVVSPLQLYLDLRHYPRRGLEQAEYLYEHVLAPVFRKRQVEAQGE